MANGTNSNTGIKYKKNWSLYNDNSDFILKINIMKENMINKTLIPTPIIAKFSAIAKLTNIRLKNILCEPNFKSICII